MHILYAISYMADLFLATEFFNFLSVSRTCILFWFVFESLQCACYDHSSHLSCMII
jgi:hypothetical protein